MYLKWEEKYFRIGKLLIHYVEDFSVRNWEIGKLFAVRKLMTKLEQRFQLGNCGFTMWKISLFAIGKLRVHHVEDISLRNWEIARPNDVQSGGGNCFYAKCLHEFEDVSVRRNFELANQPKADLK